MNLNTPAILWHMIKNEFFFQFGKLSQFIHENSPSVSRLTFPSHFPKLSDRIRMSSSIENRKKTCMVGLTLCSPKRPLVDEINVIHTWLLYQKIRLHSLHHLTLLLLNLNSDACALPSWFLCLLLKLNALTPSLSLSFSLALSLSLSLSSFADDFPFPFHFVLNRKITHSQPCDLCKWYFSSVWV